MFELAYPGGTHISSLCKQIPLQVWLLRSRNRGEHFIKLPRGIKLGLQWGINWPPTAARGWGKTITITADMYVKFDDDWKPRLWFSLDN